MPATLADYSALLRRKYLGPVADAVYSKQVLLDYLRKRTRGPGRKGREGGLVVASGPTTPRNSGWGEMIVFGVRTGRNWGTGPRADYHGTTTGYIPTSGSQHFEDGHLTPKNYWGAAEIPGKLIDNTKGIDAAALRVLDSEMRGLPADVGRHMGIDAYGDGSGKLADVTGTSSGTTIAVNSVRNLEVGEPIVVAAANGTGAVSRTISAIAPDALTITVDQATSVTSASDIFPRDVHNTNVASAAGNAISGLGLIVSATSNYAGFDRSDPTYASLRSKIIAGVALSEARIRHLEILVADMRKANGEFGLMVCDRNFYYWFADQYYQNKEWIDREKVDLGYPTLAFKGKPVVLDEYCPEWTAYLLDPDLLEWGVERELSPTGADGQEWVRVGGEDGTRRDAYWMAMKTRCELLCYNPGAQGKMTIDPTQ